MITPEEFIQAWKEFLVQEGFTQDQEGLFTNKALEWWESDKEWTQRVLGEDNIHAKSPLGDFLIDRFGNYQKYRYRLEEWKIDLVLAPVGDPEGLQDPWGTPKELPDWFKSYSMVLEHENYFHISMEEMLKLTYIRAPLKVVITYNPYTIHDQKEQEEHQRSVEILKADFSKLIEQANEGFPENPGTKYLLLVGSKVLEYGERYLKWDWSEFDSLGE